MHKLFASQLDDEEVRLVVRQHWFFLFTKLIVFFFLLLIPLIYKILAPTYLPALSEGTAGTVVNLLINLYLLVLLLSLMWVILYYYLNMQVITTMRIVDIDQKGLFDRTIAELNINKIEDVTSEAKGLGATVFDFGWVYVQTAGTKERFEFENVPKPAAVERLILDLYSKFVKEKPTVVQTPNNPTAPR